MKYNSQKGSLIRVKVVAIIVQITFPTGVWTPNFLSLTILAESMRGVLNGSCSQKLDCFYCDSSDRHKFRLSHQIQGFSPTLRYPSP